MGVTTHVSLLWGQSFGNISYCTSCTMFDRHFVNAAQKLKQHSNSNLVVTLCYFCISVDFQIIIYMHV